MVTDGVDPVVSAVWSPASGSDWIALTVAPGGGLNTQLYVVRSNGTGMRLLTDGGQDNNAFNAWSDDEQKIYIDSNRRDPALRGWLYRPKGIAGPRPYVLSFHGGPEGQERPIFRSEYQALVSQALAYSRRTSAALPALARNS